MCRLGALARDETLLSMKRFGINVEGAYGVSIKELRAVAKEIGRNHTLALELWETKVHEARELASMIDDPSLVSSEQMGRWVKDFDSWDVCDECCVNLFARTRFAHEKAIQWASHGDQFVKRAGFVLMANLAMRDKVAEDGTFTTFLSIINSNSDEKRIIVKKAIAWALREIEKRNRTAGAVQPT